MRYEHASIVIALVQHQQKRLRLAPPRTSSRPPHRRPAGALPGLRRASPRKSPRAHLSCRDWCTSIARETWKRLWRCHRRPVKLPRQASSCRQGYKRHGLSSAPWSVVRADRPAHDRPGRGTIGQRGSGEENDESEDSLISRTTIVSHHCPRPFIEQRVNIWDMTINSSFPKVNSKIDSRREYYHLPEF